MSTRNCSASPLRFPLDWELSLPVQLLAAIVFASVQPPPPDSMDAALRRLSEEAEAFARLAPEVISEEVCRQKSAKGRRGLHIGRGEAKAGAPSLSYRVREITSEFGFAPLKDGSGRLHEFRRVVAVDGRKVDGAAQARRVLTFALKAAEDRERLRLLRDFARWGLDGAVTDFSQSILLFTRRGLANFAFQPEGTGRAGPEQAIILGFRQQAGPQTFTVFDRGEVSRHALEGHLWLRQSDMLPLRIEIRTSRLQDKLPVRDTAVIDYSMSPHGALMPVSVLYRQYVEDTLVMENSLQYGPFRRFSASAEIKFTEIEEPPGKQ